MKTWLGWLVAVSVTWILLSLARFVAPVVCLLLFGISLLILALYRDVTPMIATGAVSMLWLASRRKNHGQTER